MGRRRTLYLALSFSFVIVLAYPTETAASEGARGTLRGHGRYGRVSGVPSEGVVELYEWNLFVCPLGGTSVGLSRRLGAPPGEPPRGDGFFELSLPEGLYAMYLSQPTFYCPPAVVSGVWVRAGQVTRRDIGPSVDFSCNVTDSWSLPWAETWYQTFVARGTSITGVSFRCAGTSTSRIAVSLLSGPEGTSPRTWRLISPKAQKTTRAGALGDTWVRWQSGEVPTEPGKVYCVRLRGVEGADRKFSPFSRPKQGASPPGVQAYDQYGNPRNEDLNLTVFSETGGVLLTYTKTTPGLGELRDGYFATRWGQTFVAKGRYLAAVDVWAAGAETWDLDFTFTVRETGPGGRRIGPVKTTKAAYQAFGAGLHAVCYVPGEVLLVPGRTYYVEFSNPQGFNPYVMTDPQDHYPSGAAYQNGQLRDGGAVDLAMTICEYAGGSAQLEGRVRNERGLSVASAQVVLEPGPYATLSQSDGTFAFPGLPARSYTLTTRAAGYETQREGPIALTEGESRTVEIQLRSLACDRPFRNGGFEEGLSGWTAYGASKPNVVQGPWFAGIEAVEGRYFQGNAVDGAALGRGGYLQTFCAQVGHRLRVRASSNVYWIGGGVRAARSRIGLDPTGGASAGSAGVRWSAWHVQPGEAEAGWKELSVEAEASAPLVTVFLEFLQEDLPGSRWHINCFDAVEVIDLTASQQPRFRRGDANSDGKLDLADPVVVLAYLFSGEEALCLSALDAQDDGAVDIADAVSLLQYLFGQAPPPPPPGFSCGVDPTADSLTCRNPQC